MCQALHADPLPCLTLSFTLIARPAARAALTMTIDSVAPRIVRTDTPDGPCAQPQGRWGAAELGTRAQWKLLRRQLQDNAPAATLGWDLRSLQWLDHVGAQLLWNHWGHTWPARLELTDVQRTLLERVAELTITNPPAPPPWRLFDEVARHIAPRAAPGVACQAQQIQHQLAHHLHHMPGVVQPVQHQHAQAVHLV